MSVINPLWIAEARKQWPLVGAVFVFLGFLLVHQLVFAPTADRYQRALARAGELGLSLDPNDTPQMVPPRVNALLSDNAMRSDEAKRQGDSGALSAALLQDVSTIVRRHGLEVIVTEPGPTTQQGRSVQVRAQFRLRGPYASFVAFLGDLATDSRLYAVDRFSLQPAGGSNQIIELDVSRYILKYSGPNR